MKLGIRYTFEIGNFRKVDKNEEEILKWNLKKKKR